MPRKYELTWDKTHKRWIKTIEGTKYYFEKAARKSDHEAYLRSLKSYHGLIGRNEKESPDFKVKTSRRSGSYKFVSTSIAGVAERYFSYQRSRMTAGDIQAVTLASKAYALDYFIRFCGPKSKKPNSAQEHLNEMRFGGFAKHLKNKHSKGVIAFNTARTLQQGVVQFIKWAWRNRHIEDLPRNLEDPDLKWDRYRLRKDPIAEIQIFQPDELHQIINTAYDSKNWCELRLFILLGINCGFTPIDIGHIRWNQIKKEEGQYYLEQDRSKTGVKGRWILWSETIRYFIKRFGQIKTDSDELIFITQQGRKLNRVMPMEAEHFANFDDIQRQSNTTLTRRFSALIRRAYPNKESYLSFKYLRKTGATMLSKMDINNADRVAQIYLRHSLNTTAERHYIARDFAPLNTALAELGTELGFHKA